MEDVINNNQLVLFKEQRECILSELTKEKEDIDAIINAMFSEENSEKIEDLIDGDNLPF